MGVLCWLSQEAGSQWERLAAAPRMLTVLTCSGRPAGCSGRLTEHPGRLTGCPGRLRVTATATFVSGPLQTCRHSRATMAEVNALGPAPLLHKRILGTREAHTQEGSPESGQMTLYSPLFT